jgi:hypothetical protein
LIQLRPTVTIRLLLGLWRSAAAAVAQNRQAQTEDLAVVLVEGLATQSQQQHLLAVQELLDRATTEAMLLLEGLLVL